MNDNADDPRFHFDIWKGPTASFGKARKAIYYVENYNAPCGYAEIATDFRMAASKLIEAYSDSQLGNWMAPVAHLVRQTLELELKALYEELLAHDGTVDPKPLGKHDLQHLWLTARAWLVDHGYKISIDARLDMTDSLITAFHEIDPLGDLFRFAISRKSAFKKKKSYDRVGINLDELSGDFDAAGELLRHWEAALFRQRLMKQEGWSTDPFFDIEDFPRRE